VLYLNETVTATPASLDDYVKRFSSELVPIMAKYEFHLLGLFQTWRTNELSAFWEFSDHTALDRLDKAMKQDPGLAQYARKAAEDHLTMRARTLSPTKFCPDLARIKKERLRGEVYLLAAIPLNPESMDEYLELFPQFGLKFEERYGLHTVGYWRGGGGFPYQSEAFWVTQLCCGDSWAFWATFGRQRNADSEVNAWLKRALSYRTHHSISYLVPAYLPY